MTKGNNPNPNQLVVKTPRSIIFQSYGKTICIKRDGKVYLDRIYWNYSRTTSAYRAKFLHEGIAETRRKIADGTYELKKLN